MTNQTYLEKCVLTHQIHSGLHGWPFNDQLVIYVRHAGPGVLVGQVWQEGKDLEQVPKKFCAAKDTGQNLMVHFQMAHVSLKVERQEGKIQMLKMPNMNNPLRFFNGNLMGS